MSDKLLYIVIVIGLIYFFYNSYSKSKKANNMLKNGAQVVDVRTPQEFNAGHFEGSVNIPLNTIENSIDKIKEILLKSKNVFIIQGLNDKLDDLVNISLTKKSRKRNVEGKGPVTIGDPSYIIDEMRLIKSEKEIEIMQKASDIASQAHVNAMSKSKLGDGEWNIQAIIEEHFISNKSRCSYGSIVGSGSVSYTHLTLPTN